jgi:hypothetical protein
MSEKAIPPRRRRKWLRRTLWTLLALVAVAAVVRVVAGVVMQRRLNARLNALRASGEPLLMTDMAPPEVPPERNAAVLYTQAFSLLDLMPKEFAKRVGKFVGGKEPLNEAELAEARKLLEQAADAVRLIREAAARPECRFPVKYDTQPVAGILLPHLAKLQSTSRLLELSCEVNLADGKADAAAEDCLAMLRVSRATWNEPLLITDLVELAGLQLAATQMEKVLDRSEPSASVLARFPSPPAEAEVRERFQRAMRGERCFGIDAFQLILDKPSMISQLAGETPPFGNRPLAWLLVTLGRPVILADFIHYLDDMDRYVEYAGTPLRDARGRWTALAGEIAADRQRCFLSRPISGMLLPAVSRVAEAVEWGIARERVTHAGVALRRYRLEHGQYPDALDALVPQYLKAPPQDPFTRAGLVYRREGRGVVLYSIGLNGKDDGGLDTGWRDDGDIAWRSSR